MDSLFGEHKKFKSSDRKRIARLKAPVPGGACSVEIAAMDLKSETLIRMSMSPIPLRQDYRIAYAKRRRSPPDLKKVVAALQS
ncbi:hypothetical protein [Ruegeria atlantica]|nr:hypothetical protein [Ruegeria atlantica]